MGTLAVILELGMNPDQNKNCFVELLKITKQRIDQNQSYEIKLPPRAIFGFKILEIFSVEN